MPEYKPNWFGSNDTEESKKKKWHLALTFQFGTLETNEYIRPWRVWFHLPNVSSSGGVGFRIPIMHVGITWWGFGPEEA